MPRLLIVLVILTTSGLSMAQQPATSRSKSFVVAESAFINTDMIKAEYLFKELVKDNIHDDYTFNSLDRLITIATINGDRKLFSDIINVVKGLGDPSNMAHYSLVYNIGKYLFHEGDYNLALKFLSRIPAKTPYYPKALYIKAACLGTSKKYKDAILIFDQILKMKNTDVTPDLKDLATLGKARIFMVTKRQDKAIVEYQSISQWSPYYLDSLKECARAFLAMKDYESAILHLETLAFVNKNLYKTATSNNEIWFNDSLTDFELMNLKTIQGYIYMEQGRFEEASQIFNEVIFTYNVVKKNFAEQLNRFNTSDDLTQLISHPTADGRPRSLITNAEFVLFGTSDYYSVAFREWLTSEEKNDLIRYLSVYYSVLQRTDNIDPNQVLPDEVLRLVALRNLMNKYLKAYIGLLIKKINARLDDVGLRAQLGKIDITWKTKESQSKKIKEIQEQKQGYIDDLDSKYKGAAE